MGYDSLQDFNRKRREGYYKDENDEGFLRHINTLLQSDEKKSYRELQEVHPTIFVFGLPRSGTTFMAQLIAHSFDLGYINNFMARFWLAPVTGIRLSGIILGKEAAPNFESHYATTSRLDDLHEFGYFWRHWLKKDNVDEILRSREMEETINWTGLKNIILNIHAAFGKGWICKNIFGAYHIRNHLDLLQKSFFVYIERDPLDVAISIMDARRKFYSDPSIWWSTIPYEYPEIKDLPAEEQVAGQVVFLRKLYEQEIERAGEERVIRLNYRQAAAKPLETVLHIYERIREATGIELGRRPDMPEQFPVRDYQERNVEREMFAGLMKKFQ